MDPLSMDVLYIGKNGQKQNILFALVINITIIIENILISFSLWSPLTESDYCVYSF